MKLSGTTIVELTTPGPTRLGAGIALGKLSLRRITHGRRRAVLLLATQHIETRGLRWYPSPWSKVSRMFGAKLDRVSAAQLLKREADLKRACEPVDGVNGVTVICGVMFRDQLTRTPLVFCELLVICSVHAPLALEPTAWIAYP